MERANPPSSASGVRQAFRAGTHPLPVRLVAGLLTTGVLCALLAVFLRLGASWPVVVVAAAGTGIALRLACFSALRSVARGLVVGCIGLSAIEVVNVAQYGTLSLSGPPAKVWWCGDTYRPSGAVTTGLGDEDGPPYVDMLTTPADYSVYGTFSGRSGEACGATGPLLVQVGPRTYAIYNP